MKISIREFNKNITKWLNCGTNLIITKNGKPLVRITPYVATIDVIKPIKEDNVATPKPLMSNPFEICPKHNVFRSSCGCKK